MYLSYKAGAAYRRDQSDNSRVAVGESPARRRSDTGVTDRRAGIRKMTDESSSRRGSSICRSVIEILTRASGSAD